MRLMKIIAPAAAVLSLAGVPFNTAFAGSDPTGIWIDDSGRGAVQIKPCGEALCGNVVWVKSPTDANGCGKQIIGGVTPVGEGRWDNGWIYSPEKGRKYDVELIPQSNGNLKVVGYAGLKFLSKTMIWKPAPVDLQLCGQPDSVKPDGDKKNEATEAKASPAPGPGTETPKASSEQQASVAKAPAPASDVANEGSKNTPDAKAPAASSDQKKNGTDETAKADENESADGGEGAGSDLGKMKIGDLELDKVFTRTKSGKCKLDLPWVKVTIDCEQH